MRRTLIKATQTVTAYGLIFVGCLCISSATVDMASANDPAGSIKTCRAQTPPKCPAICTEPVNSSCKGVKSCDCRK